MIHVTDAGSHRLPLLHPCCREQPVMRDLSHKTRYNWQIPRVALTLQRKLGEGDITEVYEGTATYIFEVRLGSL